MKLKKGDKLYPPEALRKRFHWWDVDFVVVKENPVGEVGVYSIDGDFYDERRLFLNDYLRPYHEYCFKHVPSHRILENE